jgi:subtilase family serine protease
MVCSYQGYPRAGTFNWGVSVDADHEIAESDERNNEQSGDIVINPVVVEEPPLEPTNSGVSSTGPTAVVITWASYKERQAWKQPSVRMRLWSR